MTRLILEDWTDILDLKPIKTPLRDGLLFEMRKGGTKLNSYIGFKAVKAEPQEKDGKPGYKVVYPDGYVSWSPQDVFEKAYMQVGNNNTIVLDCIDDFIKDVECHTWGSKTTVVKVTLVNGYEMIESSSCVDPANYDEDLGRKICLDRIRNKIWGYLGFLLQTALNGVK